MWITRRLCSAIFTFVLLLLPAAVSNGPALAQEAQPAAVAAPVATLSENNKGETIVLYANDTVAVRLHSATPGASWNIQRISNDGAQLVGQFATDSTSNISSATFQALQPGVVSITLMYVLPGATSDTPLTTFSFTLNVQNGSARPAGTTTPASTPSAAVFKPAAFVTKTPTGANIVTYGDGSTYDGGLANGLPSGQGTFNYAQSAPNGNVIDASGNWNGETLSDGDILLRGGAHYFGNLDAAGKVDGPGHFALPGGSVLTTQFTHGDYTGPTTWVLPKSALYPTQPQDKLVVDVSPPSPTLSGPATETFGSGATLVGTMVGGQFEGPATYPAATRGGQSLRGNFVHGVLQGPFDWVDSDGNTITGTMIDGVPQQNALLTTPRGGRCTGHLLKSAGLLDFNAFSGTVDANDRPDGRGTLGCPSQEQISGLFSHGKYVGLISDRATDGTLYKVNVGPNPSDSLTGPATVKLPNGDVATGFLRSQHSGVGALYGNGSYAFRGGFKETGIWKNGVFTPRVVVDDPNY